jgi:hypothetical protein
VRVVVVDVVFQRSRGWPALSIESIYRNALGVGRIRQSTEAAVMQVHSGANGH